MTKLKCETCGLDDFKNKKSLSNHKRGHSGGRFKRGDGYIFVFSPSHPYAVNSYVMEHRLVMEKKIGRLLNSGEVIHHLNGKRDDNRIENLKLLGHQREHCKEEGFGSNLKGKSKTKEHIENRRKSVIKSGVYRGNKNPNYRHGYYYDKDNPRLSKEYKEWRLKILERDDYTCVKCNSKENLHVDHIKSFALFPELRVEISNGQVLCKNCHIKTESYLEAIPKRNKKAISINNAITQ